MGKRLLLGLLILTFLALPGLHARAADARFDLVGPRIDIRVTRGTQGPNGILEQTLPIASVPNLQPGDKLWLHPDLPPTQSVHYLLICVFLRGTTNPPPDSWFLRVNTWEKKVREEGVFITVPDEAEQAVLFMAPETGGDFATLRSAVKGRPGVFVRASQDLNEAGFEQARIEKYLGSIRQVPPTASADLQKHSDLLARTLALKPNDACFKQPVDTQFTCLTQTGTQTLLDDGHAQSMVSALSNGQNADFINAASYTRIAGAGNYSAYVGAIIDLVRIMGSLHTAQYQYIPAIAFPQGESLNLRLNTPPSFHNPKSVLVIGLPAVQKAVAPPLRSADPIHVACLLQPTVVLPIEGAPLVFSTSFAHDLTLHLNTPANATPEPDIPLAADAFQGGLVLQPSASPRTELRDSSTLLKPLLAPEPNPFAHPDTHAAAATPAAAPSHPSPEPVLLTGTIMGRWGFDTFTGPSVQLQQRPGTGWHIVAAEAVPSELIAGRSAHLVIASTGDACVHTITAQPTGAEATLQVSFKPEPQPRSVSSDPASEATPPTHLDAVPLALTLPLEHAEQPGDLHLEIQQYGQPSPDQLSTRTYAEPAHVTAVELHAGDRSLRLTGTELGEVRSVRVGDLSFQDSASSGPGSSLTSLSLSLPGDNPPPPTRTNEHLSATVILNDGRMLAVPFTVAPPRPVLTLLRKASDAPPKPLIAISSPDDAPLSERLTFTLKSVQPFPRNGEVEVETLDGTLRAVLTLAPSGGLVLQDPHTVVATLDPLRAFGPSAFGPIHLRALYPQPHTTHSSRDDHVPPPEPPVAQVADAAASTASGPANGNNADLGIASDNSAVSDWLPLATLVRLPTLNQLACPADLSQPCTLTGVNLFLLQAVSSNPQFSIPTPVPDGFTGSSLAVPHPTAGTLFLKLRDDPGPVDSASIPTPPATPATPSATMAAHKIPTRQPAP